MRFLNCLVAPLLIAGAVGQFQMADFLAPRTLGDSVADVQSLYNGFYEQSGLPDPTTVVACYDESSAQLQLTFLQNLMSDIANNNILAAQADISKFEQQLPPQVQSCLKGNQEFQNALTHYNVAGQTLDQITNKLEAYTVTHFLQIKKLSQTASDEFSSGDFVGVGKTGAVIAQDVYLGGEEESLGDDSATIQQTMNGFWEAASLSDPTTPVSCFDTASAALTVQFMGNVLQQLADSDVNGAKTTVETYVNALPQAVKTCLGADAEVQQALTAYHIAGQSASQVEEDIVKFFVEHILALHKDAVEANNNWKGGNYKDVGTEGGNIAKQIFGSSHKNPELQALVKKMINQMTTVTVDESEDIDDDTIATVLEMFSNEGLTLRDDSDTIQQTFNGFWEAGSLSDPTTPVACFDAASATLSVQAMGNVLQELADSDVNAAKSTIETFVNALPQAVKDCLGADAQVQQLLTAYHIAGLSGNQVEEDIIKFFVEHILALHKDAVQANNDWKAGNYKSVGTEGGNIAHQIFG